MDLDAAQIKSNRKAGRAKAFAYLCFGLSCGLLAGSLILPVKARDPLVGARPAFAKVSPGHG